MYHRFTIHRWILALLPVFIFSFAVAQKKHIYASKSQISVLVAKSLNRASQQYIVLKQKVTGQKVAKNYDLRLKQVSTANSSDWISGFYPGTLLYLYQYSGDTTLLAEAKQKLNLLEKEQYNKTTHDLGFMMYCSFGNANKLNSSSQYQRILLNSARSLASRFDPKIGCIRSWDSKPGHFLVIIDNMINLELLFWATHVTGDSSFYKIAVTHANTTIKNHFRPNYSCYHVVDYDPETGTVQAKKTNQGYADESAWARGQAWALYGFTMAYRETKQLSYLKQACNIAQYIIKYSNLPVDGVPYWDYNLPDSLKLYRDASAAAVMASALIELSSYTDKAHSRQFIGQAETMLLSLSSPIYRAKGSEAGGFLLKHSVGNLPAHSEIDVSLSYADYYYVEAMLRYQQLNKN